MKKLDFPKLELEKMGLLTTMQGLVDHQNASNKQYFKLKSLTKSSSTPTTNMKNPIDSSKRKMCICQEAITEKNKKKKRRILHYNTENGRMR